MAAEFEQLPLDVRPIAGLDADARVAHIRAEQWVQHAAADRVLGYLQEALVQPPKDRMENILLSGKSGMGKTMLVRKFERQNAARFDDVAGLQRRPVVAMLMPHHPTEARFFDQLLVAMNAPAGGHFIRSCPSQEQAIRYAAPAARVPAAAALLSNELRIAFVGVAVPEARHALWSDDQLRSGFTDVELPPWSLGEDLRDFRDPADLEFAAARAVAGGLFETAAPARGANGRYYARDLQGLRAGRDRRDPSQPCEAASIARPGADLHVTVAPLPLAPRPHPGEATSSWVEGVAARYDLTADHLASHVLARRSIGIHRVAHLDHRGDAELELALATATQLTPDRIRALKIAGDDGSASRWHRLTLVWCPECVRSDLLDMGEVYERALWRLGCCVMWPVHGIPLEDRCSRCMAGARCRFRAADGLLRLACTGCERLVDPAPHSAVNDTSIAAFGVCLDACTHSACWPVTRRPAGRAGRHTAQAAMGLCTVG